MVVLRKRKFKHRSVYVVDFVHNGKRHIRTTGTADKRLAEKVRAEIESKIIHGIFRLEEQDAKDITVSGFLKIYFDSTRGMKADSTVMVEKIRTATFKRVVGDVDLRSITNQVLERWRSERLR